MNMFDWQRAYFQDGDTMTLRASWPTMAVLAAYANFNTGICFPSQATLARRLGYRKTDTVREHLKANVAAGWLRVIHQGTHAGDPSRYEFTIPATHTPPVKRGSEQPSRQPTPPAERGSEADSPRGSGEYSPRRTAVTPPVKRGLTTKGTTKGNHEVSSPLEDPWGSSGVGLFKSNERSSTTQIHSPRRTGECSPAKPDPWESVPFDDEPRVRPTKPEPAVKATGPKPGPGEPGFDPWADWNPGT
jgi:hypothetical protein